MDDAAFRQLVDQVRERTDLAALVGETVQLSPAGSVLKGRSPWARDTNPSLVVWPHTRTWRDFSGGGSLGGDCFDWVERRDGVPFMEALRALADQANLDVPGGSDPALAAELERDLRATPRRGAAHRRRGLLPRRLALEDPRGVVPQALRLHRRDHRRAAARLGRRPPLPAPDRAAGRDRRRGARHRALRAPQGRPHRGLLSRPAGVPVLAARSRRLLHRPRHRAHRRGALGAGQVQEAAHALGPAPLRLGPRRQRDLLQRGRRPRRRRAADHRGRHRLHQRHAGRRAVHLAGDRSLPQAGPSEARRAHRTLLPRRHLQRRRGERRRRGRGHRDRPGPACRRP